MDQRAEGGRGGSHGNTRKGGQRHGISNRLPKSSARRTPNFAPWNDSASSDSSSDEDSSEDDEDDENSEGDDDDEYNAYNNYEEDEHAEGTEMLPQYGYAEDSINVGPASGTTSAYYTPGAPHAIYTPGQVHYTQTMYRETAPTAASLQSATGESPGYNLPPRHPSFLPSAVLYNNPTLINTPRPALATAAVQNPATGNSGNSRPDHRPQNPAAGNSNNSRPKDRPQNPSNKKKKPFRKPKRFYPAELFGHKRPSGVMEAYEAAKIAGPTKKEKKAMGKAKLRSMNWPCPLCNGIFYGERHVRSHLRSKAHAKSSVWLDKKTFKIWINTSPKPGRRKKKKKKGKKAKAKAKAAEQEKQKQKEKKAVPVVPTAVNLPEPAEGVIDNLVEGLNDLALELPTVDAGKQEAGMAEHV